MHYGRLPIRLPQDLLIFSLWQEILQTVTLIRIRPDVHGVRFDQQVFLTISLNNSSSRIFNLPDFYVSHLPDQIYAVGHPDQYGLIWSI